MKRFSVIALSCLLLASGCASIVSKTRYPVAISSAPDKAQFTITDVRGREVLSGTTPTVVHLKAGGGYFKKQTYAIKFSKEGYDAKVMTIQADLNGWYFGNLLFGGAIGMLIVDPITGAMWKIDQRDVQGVLNQTSAYSGSPDGEALNILSVDDVPENLKPKMVPLKQE
jgi:hypothetical protein